MVGTIAPVGGRRFVQVRASLGVAAAFLVGSLGGAIAIGSALGWVGSEISSDVIGSRAIALMIIVVAAASILTELGHMKVRLPMLRRQVPASWWVKYDRRVAAFMSGLELGTGVTTLVTWAGFYVLLIGVVSLELPGSVLVLAAFGFARGVQPLVVSVVAAARTIEQTNVLAEHVRQVTSASWRRAGIGALCLAIVGQGTALSI